MSRRVKTPKKIYLPERTQLLSDYLYGLVRVLDCCGAWIGSLSDLDFKITLAFKMGHDALCIKALKERLSELGKQELSASKEYAEFLDQAAKLKTELQVAGFICTWATELLENITAYEKSVSAIGEEPTLKILRDLKENLKSQLRAFSKFSGKKKTVLKKIKHSGERRMYSGQEPLPELVSWPARPAKYKHTDRRPEYETVYHQIFSEEGLIRHLHSLFIDIEIAATEVCARNIAEFREMPIEFKCDMARQCWDEARHARLVLERSKSIKTKLKEFTYAGNVWNSYMKGKTLAERITIEQIVLEGAGVDQGVEKVKLFREMGDEDTAYLYETINTDEKNHVKFGERWLRYLVNDSQEQYESTIKRVRTMLFGSQGNQAT